MGAISEKIYYGTGLVSDANPFPVTLSTTTPGSVVGGTVTLIPAIAVTASSAYTAGNSIGGKITLTGAVRASGKASRLENIHLLDRANQKPAGYILIFNADPSAATLTDKTAFVYSTDDLKEVARIDVSTADWVTINSKAVADIPYSGRLITASGSANLYAAFITTSTPTFAATSDFQAVFSFSYAN